MNKIIAFLFTVSLISLIAFIVFRISVSNAKTEQVKSIPTITQVVSPSVQPTFYPTAPADQKSIETQILKATYSWGKGLQPTEFKVKSGMPVRFEVFAEIDGVGCMGSIMIPYLSLSIQEFIKGQTNVFEFTPERPGEYEITCAMGIPHGSIIVK